MTKTQKDISDTEAESARKAVQVKGSAKQQEKLRKELAKAGGCTVWELWRGEPSRPAQYRTRAVQYSRIRRDMLTSSSSLLFARHIHFVGWIMRSAMDSLGFIESWQSGLVWIVLNMKRTISIPTPVNITTNTVSILTL